MRVLHVDTADTLRGGQMQLLILARGLRHRGYRQVIVCPESSALARQAGGEGFEVFELPAHDPGHWNGSFQLRQRLLADPFDIVHAHDGKGQTIAWLATAGAGIVRVASRRVTFLPRGRTSRYGLHRLKYDFTCDGIIAVSNYIRDLLVESGIPASKIEVIPDATDPPAELPTPELRAKIRAAWGLGENAFVAGHLGAFAPEKGQDVAIKAAMLLRERLPDLRLVLAGEASPDDRRTLEPMLRDARDRVRLLPRFDDPAGFFPGLDLYLMPSRAEGLGSSALLAMGYGLPVVASRVGGLPEIVEKGRTGWLVPSGSPQDLAGAILAAASDHTRLCQYGSAARESSFRFASGILVSRTEEFYRRLSRVQPLKS